MRSFTTSALLSATALSSLSSAIVTLGIAKTGPASINKRQLNSRATVLENLGNNVTGQSYMAVVSVGTPPQSISLAIDTGSSDTWLLDVTTDLCTNKELQAEQGSGCETPYDPTKSSTYKLVDAGAFSITYGDSSGAGGDYISDNVAIGGATIKPLEMGLAKSANLTQGLLGIGYTFNEASNTGASDSFEYPNIIDSMVSQGFIDVNAYSLYLDDLDASTGSIIFGGLDTDKFHGNLVQMPVVPHQFDNGTSYYSDFGVALTSFKIAGKDLTPTGSPIGPILDSGTSLTYLPTTIAQGIITQLGAFDDSQNPEGSGFILVNCNLQSSTSTFDFGFGGTDGSDSVTISIPYNEMVITPSKLGADLNGYQPKGITFSDICILGVLPSDSAPYILGDTFLRSAYVVYDLKNNIIGLAQTNFDSTSSNVVDFTASMTAIPAASGVASGAGISQTATGVAGGKTTAAGTATATGTSTSKSAGVASVPALDFTALFVVGGSAMLAVLGGSLLLA